MVLAGRRVREKVLAAAVLGDWTKALADCLLSRRGVRTLDTG